MDDETKLEVSTKAAKMIMAKFKTNRLEFPELVNIGFVHIKSNDASKALQEAYFWILNRASRQLGYEYKERDPRDLIKIRNEEVSLDERIDLQDSIEKLRPSDREIIRLYFERGYTLAQLAKHRGVKHGGWLLNSIMEKIKSRLIE